MHTAGEHRGWHFNTRFYLFLANQSNLDLVFKSEDAQMEWWSEAN